MGNLKRLETGDLRPFPDVCSSKVNVAQVISRVRFKAAPLCVLVGGEESSGGKFGMPNRGIVSFDGLLTM